MMFHRIFCQQDTTFLDKEIFHLVSYHYKNFKQYSYIKIMKYQKSWTPNFQIKCPKMFKDISILNFLCLMKDHFACKLFHKQS